MKMEQELKNQIFNMTKHIKKWLDEARIYNEDDRVRRCIENAENGYIRIENLILES
jgi:hypothetical protein